MSEVSLFPLSLIVFFAIWAAVGPLVGIAVGHYLVRSWERRRWLADNRKEEFKQVLVALNNVTCSSLTGMNEIVNPAALKEAAGKAAWR